MGDYDDHAERILNFLFSTGGVDFHGITMCLRSPDRVHHRMYLL